MFARTVSTIIVALLLMSMIMALDIKPLEADWEGSCITIRSDGSLDPPTAPIERNGDIYTLTDDIYIADDDGIWIQRDNMTLDGAGHTLDGGGNAVTGVWLSGRFNVTVRYVTIQAFGWGVQFYHSNNCTVSDSTIRDCGDSGIRFLYSTSSYNNSILRNKVIDNYFGIVFYETTQPDYMGNKVYHNDFIGNTKQVWEIIGCDDWDDGYPSGGNYWSDYPGVDEKSGPNQDQPGSDGIGDVPYVIGSLGEDRIFQDRYPLIKIISNDVYAVSVEPIQVVEDASALIRYKDTALQVDVMNTFATTQWVKIEATYDFGHASYTESGRDRKGIMLKQGLNRIYLPGGPVYDWQGGNWVERDGPWIPLGPSGQLLGEDFFFKWNTQTGVDDNIKVRVQPLPSEISRNNNEKTISSKITETDSLDVVYVPLSMLGEYAPQGIEEDKSNGDLYLSATFPVDQVTSVIGYPKVLPYSFPYDPFGLLQLYGVLLTMDQMRWLSGTDKVVCIVPTSPESWLHQHYPLKFPSGTIGVTPPIPWVGSLNVVIVEDTYWAAIPHEIGHTFGLRLIQEEYDGTDGNNAAGFSVSTRSRLEDSLCIMGKSASSKPLGKPLGLVDGFRKNYNSGYWICDDCYGNLLAKLRKGTDPEVIYMSGIIFGNDTTVLNPWYHKLSGMADLPLGQTGNYSIVFFDGSDTVIGQTGFNATFEAEMDQLNFTAFAFSVEYPSQTKRIQIVHNGFPTVDRYVSPNAPSLTVSSPNGGETIAGGMNYTISWSGEDPDGDQLLFSLQYSKDGGANWIPITESLNETSYNWDTSRLESTDQCLVKVVATDGVNMGEDISDSAFTVDPDPPVITVFSPQAQIYYSDSVPLSLKIDEDLSLSSIWYSLDNQSSVTIEETCFIDVPDGAHQIMFYANDTTGNVGFSNVISFEVNSSAYYPWQTGFVGSGGYPITDMAEYDGQLYAARDNVLCRYDGSGWTVIEAPTHALTLEYYDGTLFIGGKGGLYAFDGSDFYLIFGVPNYIKVLGVYNNTLYAGTFLDNPPTLYYCNGSADNPDNWHIDTDFSTLLNFSGPFGSIDSFAVYNDIMYLDCGGTLYSFDRTDWNIAASYGDVFAFLDTQVYNGNLYLATRDQGWRKPYYQGGTGFSGRVIEFDGTSWTTILDHDYWIYSLEVCDNKLYAGTANKILTYNGTSWETSFNATEGAYYAISMITFDGKIYAGIGNGYIFADPAPPKPNPETTTTPEFPSATFLTVFMMATLLSAILLRKRKHLSANRLLER